MIQSESLTHTAIVALAKSVTRRDWKESTRKWYRRGRVFDCYDKVPYHGGRLIAQARCTCDAYLEPLGDMPDEDWAGEGFKWMHEHPVAIPEKARQYTWSVRDCAFRSFQLWRAFGAETVVTVCRFEIIHVEDWAIERLENILLSDGVLKA